MNEEVLQGFDGFEAGRTRFTPIPNQFFGELLPIIDDLNELKAVLYAFWKMGQQSGDVRYLRLPDVLSDHILLQSMGPETDKQEERARSAFARAAQRGVLLEITVKRGDAQETWYFLNSEKGRQAIAKLRKGEFEHLLHDIDDVIVGLEKERPHVFLLYEQNIGMITPMIADRLWLAERLYPAAWIEEAFAEAVVHNARNWAYIERILQKWAKHGKETTQKAGRSAAENPIRDSFSDDDDTLFVLE